MRLEHKTRHIDLKRKSKSCMTTQIKTEKIFKKYIRLVKDKRKKRKFPALLENTDSKNK